MKQLLRVMTMPIALIASGLAVVAIAPAPPAAAYAKSFDQVEVTPTTQFGQAQVCAPGGVQTPSSWFRRFSLADDVGTGQVFSASSVRFAVDWVMPRSGASSVSVKVRVYPYPANEPLTWEKLRAATPSDATATVTRDSINQVVKIEHDFGSFGRSEDVVVEVFYPGGSGTDERFLIGSTSRLEEADGFFSYPTCTATLADIQPPPTIDHQPRWDEIQPIWPVWKQMNVVIGVDGDIGLDRDGDLVPDVLDDCPGRSGPRGGGHSGCPILLQVVTATYDPKSDVVSGKVSIDVPEGTDGVSCLDSVKVSLYDESTGALVGSANTSSGTNRTYSIPASAISEGKRGYVIAEAFFDDDPALGEGLAVCLASRSAYVAVNGRADYDGDRVLNADDECPDVPGSLNAEMNGCPLVSRTVTAELKNGAVSGLVAVHRPAGAPAGACGLPARVRVWWTGGPTRVLLGETTTAGDGTYSAWVGPFYDDRSKLEATVPGLRQLSEALCLEGSSDHDIDGVRDSGDNCFDVPQEGIATKPGCPNLRREVTATYASGAVSGKVTFTDARVPRTACARAEHTRVQVWRQLSDEDWDVELTKAGLYSAVDGRFEIELGEELPVGTKYWIRVRDAVDPDAGWCGDVYSGPFTVAPTDLDIDGDGVPVELDACPTAKGDGTSADGCPTVEREFTDVTYVGGVVSGVLRVTDSTVGGCAAENRVRVLPERGNSRYGLAAATTGAFEIAVALAEGEGYALEAERTLDVGAGWCEGVRLEATVPTDLDGDGVPVELDACPTAKGDGTSADGCPTVEREFTDVTYVGGVVSGVLRVTDSTVGGCAAENRVRVLPERGNSRYGLAAATTGAFEIAVALAEGEGYALEAERTLDVGAGWCEGVRLEATVPTDLDGDGVNDDEDGCDELDGDFDEDPAYSGCPVLERSVTASYAGGTVSGSVTTEVSGACAQEQAVTVEVNGRAGHVNTTTQTDGTYAVELGLPVDAQFTVEAPRELDESGKGICGRVVSETIDVPGDSDGVDGDVDRCPDVNGPEEDDFPGCPTLERTVTAQYAAGTTPGAPGRITGQVSTVGSSACAHSAAMEVFEVTPEGVTRPAVPFTTEPGGSFFLGSRMRDGSQFQIVAKRELDPGLKGICGRAETGFVEVPYDRDDDGVADDGDDCPGVWGDDADFAGCPTLDRSVTAEYAGGKIKGLVTAVAGCSGGVAMEAVEVAPDGARGVPVGFSTEANGTFAWQPTSAHGARVRIVAVRALELHGLGVCAAAESATVQLPGDDDGDSVADDIDECPGVDGAAGGGHPGCPRLTRTVTASYAGGAITGQVSVLGPHPAPAGTCLPTQVRAFTIQNGSRMQVGTTTATSADGGFTIAVAGGLAAGTTYLVSMPEQYAEGHAVCAAAESATWQIPVPVVAGPPGGSGPGAGPGSGQVAPVLTGVKLTKKVIHVLGSSAKPRTTKLKLRLNVAATVVVKLKGVSKATGTKAGRTIRAKVTKALGAGRSTIRLTGKVGTKRLPPGKYILTVRATNPVGAATATGGRLRVKL